MAEWERVGDVGVFYGAGRFSRGQLGLPQLSGEKDATSLPQFGVSDRLVGEPLAGVAAGMEHSVFLTVSGKVFACGTNRLGQCGIAGKNHVAAPTPVPLPPRRSRRRARKSSSVGEMGADGDAAGEDEAAGEEEEEEEEEDGAVGDGDGGEACVRGKQHRIVKVACGSHHTMLLTSRGVLLSFGNYKRDQLGRDGGDPGRATVVRLRSKSLCMVDVACGGEHTLAVTRDGFVYSWGRGTEGQLGRLPMLDGPLPREIDREGFAGSVVVAVAAGRNTSFALTDEGHVFAWGDDSNGMLGRTATGAPGGLPRRILFPDRTAHVTALTLGSQHAVAMTDAGRLYVWGANAQGQLGLGHRRDVMTPKELVLGERGDDAAQLLGVARLVHKPRLCRAGYEHTLIITHTGDVFGFGDNSDGQLGFAEPTSVAEPTRLPCACAAVDCAVGSFHSLVVPETPVTSAWSASLRRLLADAPFADITFLFDGHPGVGVEAHLFILLARCRPLLDMVTALRVSSSAPTTTDGSDTDEDGGAQELVVAPPAEPAGTRPLRRAESNEDEQVFMRRVSERLRASSTAGSSHTGNSTSAASGSHMVIKLRGVRPPVFRRFLEFLYTDFCVDLASDEAFAMMDFLEAYAIPHLPRLQALCERAVVDEKHGSALLPPESLQQDLVAVTNQAALSDAMFVTAGDDETITYAHKALLASRAGDFCAKVDLEADPDASDETGVAEVVRLPEGISAQAFRDFVSFVYTGAVPAAMDDARVVALLDLASRFAVVALEARLRPEIARRVTGANATAILALTRNAGGCHAWTKRCAYARLLAEHGERAAAAGGLSDGERGELETLLEQARAEEASEDPTASPDTRTRATKLKGFLRKIRNKVKR